MSLRQKPAADFVNPRKLILLVDFRAKSDGLRQRGRVLSDVDTLHAAERESEPTSKEVQTRSGIRINNKARRLG
jgi:hypothetical protein